MNDLLRIKTETRYKKIYNDLKNLVVGDFHELFYVCVCLGYQRKQKKELGGPKNDRDRFWSDTITPKEWACYNSIYLVEHAMELELIKDDKAVMIEMEKYANAGMEILIKECLKLYTIEKSGELQLDPTLSKELPKHFLYYLFDQNDQGERRNHQ